MFFALTGTVRAEGGAGGGGSGGGGAGGHQTSYGWGWTVYDISSGSPGRAGPTNGFRNGDNWGRVLGICDGARARSVYAFIVYNASSDAKIYDYQRSWDSFRSHFPDGTRVDHNKAVAIPTSQAEDRYNRIDEPPYNVDTTGLSFGSNVGWFCYDAQDAPPPSNVNASCTITGYPSSVQPGQSFSATINVTNSGNTVWSVDPTVSDRFKLGSQSPQDNNTWGTSRLEIAGEPSGFGYVVRNGNTTTTWPTPATFTAPSSPGTYTLAWQVLRENVSWYGSVCSVPITVSPPPGADCPPPWDNPRRTVSLPQQGAPGSTHTEIRSYTGESQVNSVQDEWGENTPYTDHRNSTVTLDYTPHIENYPYDTHTPTIRYQMRYRTDYYEHHEHPYDCSYTDSTGRYIRRTCYNHEDHYLRTDYGWTGEQSTNGPTMPPCWTRGFELDPVPHTNGVTWRNYDEEEPGYVSFGSHVDVRFFLPERQTGLRQPMRLNYTATAGYWIDRNGVIMPYPQGRYSGGGCTNRFSGNETIGDAYSPGTRSEDYLDCFNATIPPLQAGDRACFRFNTAYQRGRIDRNGDIVGGTTSGSTQFSDCSIHLVDRPYFKVFGGDVLSGASNFGTCSPGSGPISAWNRGNRSANPTYGSSAYGGSGAQLLTYATGSITQFVSDMARARLPSDSPRRLTFANTSGTYGGNWNSSNVPCQEDYFAQRRGGDPGSSVNLSGLDGSFSRSGNTTITGGSVPQGRRIAIFVDGDVAITGNINFVGSYNGVDRIPSVRIIARGNIYISPSVSNLDAILVAQNNGASGGVVSTCSDGGFAMPTANQLTNICRNRLTINGAVLAIGIRFMRTAGSIRSGNNAHDPSNPTIAEVINFTPEVWLATPAAIEPERETYEAFTSLPPIL